jgi:hypothetical protein
MSDRFPRSTESGGAGARFLLITDCLQNDFFLNNVSPVALPEATRRAILLGRRNFDLSFREGDQLRAGEKDLEQGPLGIFLRSTIGRRFTGEAGDGILHVVNIRQWRGRDQAYEEEGPPKAYCETGTWGARYIDGLARYLDPLPPEPDGRAAFCGRGSVRIYHVHADSTFDFHPRWEERRASDGKFRSSELERLLDVLLTGSDEMVDRLARVFGGDVDTAADDHAPVRRSRSLALSELAANAVQTNVVAETSQVYVAVIGVYTDVHVLTLLFGLRDRYALPHLAISDTLTGAATVERHVSGLHLAANLLDVDVVHGVNELTRLLGSPPALENEWEVLAGKPYAAYAALDEQTQRMTAQQEERLQAYLALVEGRSARVYGRIERANTFLIRWGTAFLSLTLLFVVLHPLFPDRIPWQLAVVTGGISLAQFATAFFANPADSLHQNLINLAALRMILESHSLKSVFARLYLAPSRIGYVDTAEDANRAEREAELTILRTRALAGQLQLLNEIDAVDYEALKRFGRVQHEPSGAPVHEVPAVDGAAAAAPEPSDGAV